MIFALAGNQNCGKTTLFNQLTGSNQHVGNFPGVTVDQKSGSIRGQKDCTVVDLPGIYSIRPYTPEEIVTRDFILNQKPDGLINIVDATNIERNLYLTLQLMEMRIPMVLALNMMDEVSANGGTIDVKAMSQALGIPVVPISAVKNEGVEELVRIAVATAKNKVYPTVYDFCSPGPVHRCIHAVIHQIEDHAQKADIPVRFAATKLIEGDTDIDERLELDQNEKELIEHSVQEMESECGMDRNAALADMRYNFIEEVCAGTVVKCRESRERQRSEAIDRIVTGKYLALPIFFGIMLAIFYLTFNVIGAFLSDLLAAGIDALTAAVDAGLTAYGLNPVVHSLVIDGVFAGVGSVLSFLPIIVVLFFFLSILEDTGYMARVAFVMDRVFRRFGLSGKSFIPMLISSGCGVPGVMATKTIENEKDRRMTAMLTTMIPCGAKTPIIALVMGVLIGGSDAWWVAPMFYFLGLAAIVVSALMLKKTKMFAGEPAPFVMELPDYHLPTLKSWWLHVWERISAYLKKATTIIFAASVVVWFLLEFGFANWEGGNGAFGFMSLMEGAPEYYTDYSLLAIVGNALAWIFAPLGADTWQAAAASINALIAKENLVSTFGVIYGIGDATENSVTMWSGFAGMFTDASGILHVGAMCAFVAFNMLDAPCFAAIGTIRKQMDSPKWFWFAIGYQCVFAWCVGLIINQLWELFVLGNFGLWTVVAFVLLAGMIFQIVRPMPKQDEKDEKVLAQLC